MSKDCFQAFVEAGGSLYIAIPVPYGNEDRAISAEQARRFLCDREGLIAELLGVSRREYRGWLEESCSVRCCATTRSGRRCRSIVPGGTNVDACKWVSMQGSYCYTHEEGRLG